MNKFIDQYPQLWFPKVNDMVRIVTPHLLLPQGTKCQIIECREYDMLLLDGISEIIDGVRVKGKIWVQKCHVEPYEQVS